GWAMPLMLAIATLGVGGVIWWASHQPPPGEARVNVSHPEAGAVGTSGTIAGKFTRYLPGNVPVTIPHGGPEDHLLAYLGSARSGGTTTTIDFNRVAFN